MLERRLEFASRYESLLEGEGILVSPVTPGGVHSRQSYCVFVSKRNRIMETMRAEGIEVQIGTYSLHMQPAFQNSSLCKVVGDLKGSQFAFEHCLALPMYHGMKFEDQKRVVSAIQSHLTI